MDKNGLSQLLARYYSSEYGFNLEGGFRSFVGMDPARGWSNLEAPWPGELRLIPATRALGMVHWRHATAAELLQWAMQGCPGWKRSQHPSVLAAASSYNGAACVARIAPGPRIFSVRTELLGADGSSPKARLKAYLRKEPDGLALCAVPRA